MHSLASYHQLPAACRREQKGTCAPALAPAALPARHRASTSTSTSTSRRQWGGPGGSCTGRDLRVAPLARVSMMEPPGAAAAAPADAAAKLADTRVCVFSSQQYVRDFLAAPLHATFPKAMFVEPKLDTTTAKLAEGCEVVVAFVNDVVTKEVINLLAAGGTKMIAMRCAGFDRVDMEAVAAAGIKVARVPTYSPTSVAEHAVAHMFALNRSIASAHQRTMQGNYSLNGLVGFEMCSKVVGIIGTGAIGYEACRILKGIGCKVIAYDIYQNPKVLEMGIPYQSIEEMLPQCDIVSLHCPLLPSTHHLINAKTIAMMKPGAMLVNVSRGGLVESDALFEALESGQIGNLGLDVYEDEGDIFFVDHTMYNSKQRMKQWNRKLMSLLSYPQVLVTPHSAFLTNEALSNIANTTVANISNFVLGQPLGKNEVVWTPPKA